MAAPTSSSSFPNNTLLGRAIIEKCQNDRFLDEDLSSKIEKNELPAAYELIGKAKSEAEDQLRTHSRDVAPRIDTWIKHAASLQADIDQSKLIGKKIVQDAEKGEELKRTAQDAYVHSQFLRKEISYNDILLASMERIRSIKADIDGAELSTAQHETMRAVKLLSEAFRSIHSLPNYHRIRAFTLLEGRALSVKEALLKDFDRLWELLITVNSEKKVVRIRHILEGEPMNLRKATLALENLGQIDVKVQGLAEAYDRVVLQPRLDLRPGVKLYSFIADGNSLNISGKETDSSIGALFEDLLLACEFLAANLPDLSSQLAKAIIPGLCTQLRDTWLSDVIPTEINDMEPFKAAVGKVICFTDGLKKINWSWTDTLEEWVTSCARLWVTKRREHDLATVKDQLAMGLSSKRTIKKSQTQDVSVPDNTLGVNGDDWNEAWSDDEKETPTIEDKAEKPTAADDEDDAWGAWGDDEPADLDASVETIPQTVAPKLSQKNGLSKTSTITLNWEYQVSSMTDGVITVIKTAIDDALALTQPAQADNPIAPAAVVLFAVPTLTLAMYRAVSPYYYANAEGGNMYAYNDSLWVAEELEKIATEWNSRPDLTTRAQGKVKFEGEIASMNKFGRRAYSRELTTQKTIIRDLLRGDQCFLSEDGIIGFEDDEAAIDNVVFHVRLMSETWEPILARTNWAQAIGSLLSAIADKIILDILDLEGLASEATQNIATLISKVVALEDLFAAKPTSAAQELPLTAVEYAPSWFKFQYLSELLQSNLESMRYYWFEGDVSYFYTPEEVVDLIELQFADTLKKAELIRDIRHNRQPKA